MRPRAVTPAVDGVRRGVLFPAFPVRGRARAAILIADDDEAVRTELATCIRRQACTVETATDLSAALDALARAEFDLVFADVPVVGGDAELLAQMRKRRPGAALVLMTAHATVSEAVHAMQAGAYDYLVKPLDLEHVQMLVRRILAGKMPLRSGGAGSETIATSFILESANPAMQKAIATARRVAASDLPVLFLGESGTGKHVLATCVHAWSRRGTRSFAAIPCTTLADQLLESELLPHPTGTVIGARHDTPGWLGAVSGGTLFLDEVGDLPRQLQGELLRLLAAQRAGSPDDPPVDARVIAATKRNLEEEVAAGRFREDLFFRLNVVAISMPPLRERSEDLVALTDRFLTRLAARYGRDTVRISPELRQILAAYHWPGNTRELVDVLESALVLSEGDTITPHHLPDRLLGRRNDDAPPVTALSLGELERRHIERVVAGSRTLEEAAARLGVNATTLWRKRKRYRMGTDRDGRRTSR
jgi:two-component system, NtrC family, response regulator AlgB